MTGLVQVRAAVEKRLRDAGLTVLSRYGRDRAKRYATPIVVVGVGQTTGKPLGFFDYLGERFDPKTQSFSELYGRRLEVTISLEGYAPVAADDCEAVLETAAEALLSGLPSGLKLGETTWEDVSWDGESRMFVRRGSVQCTAYFTAAVSGETGLLLDFELKGVVHS
ncbi:MAG: hypothetical protein RRY95_01360 [Oscillospiraceae bacterium]